MSNKGDGFGAVSINNKNYEVIKIGSSLIKRRYDTIDENGCTILKIKCSAGSNVLNIFNQLTSNVESIKIFNESNINIDINKNTTLPNLNVDNNSTNQYTTWTLPNGNYKVFIKGEFSIKDSTCEILKVKLQNNLTTGYKMFYNCNIIKANSNYEIKIPDSMTNTESMFENSNINHTVKVNLLITIKCFAMYKNCTNLKKIHINYIEAFNNEDTLCPNLSESNYNECFAGCENIRCGNLNSNINNKPKVFLWDNIPYSWGGPIDAPEKLNVFEIEANDTNGLTLTLVQHINENNIMEDLSATDWGDGIKNYDLSHTYNKPGTYIVKTRLQPNNINTGDPVGSYNKLNDNKLIKKVINVRNDIRNLSYFCYKCLNMEQFYCGNIINATDMSLMFKYCKSLTSLDVSNFDTSKVIDMGSMFYFCNSLTSLDVSNFNTSNVTDMSGMFGICKSLTSLDISNFDTSKVTDMSNIFYECNSLTSLDLSNFNTSNVVDMSHMFDNCESLTSLDISNFDTSKVTNMHSIFNFCKSLTSLDVSNFNTLNVTDMGAMFLVCDSLTSLDLSSFDTSNVTNMSFMFSCCDSLTSLDLSNFNTSKVTDMRDMFSHCNSLTSLDVSNFDTSKVTNMRYMFWHCESLTSLNLFDFNASNLIYIGTIFNSCKKLLNINFEITSRLEYGDSGFINNSGINYILIKGTLTDYNLNKFIYNLPTMPLSNTGTLDTSNLSNQSINLILSSSSILNSAHAKNWKFTCEN